MNRVEFFSEGFGIGVLLFWALLFFAVIACWFTGIWLAFAAALWLGVVLIFVPPVALVCGVAYWLGGLDLAEMLIQWLR